MTLLKDMKIDVRGPKIISYGRPGSGKSAFWLTLGAGSIYLDCDCGWRTGLTLKDRWSDSRGLVELKECWETDGSKATAFSKTASYIQAIVAGVKDKSCKARVVVLDSFTSLAEAAMRDVLYTNGKLGTNPEIQHWSMMYNRIEQVLMNLKSLPLAVVLIMHQEIHEIDGVDTITLACPGQKLAPRITPYFDEILYSRVKNGAGGKNEYVIQSKSTASLPVRSRNNVPEGYNTNDGAVRLLKDYMGYDVSIIETSK